MSSESRIQKILDENGLNADGTLTEESKEGLSERGIAREQRLATECVKEDMRAYEERIAELQPTPEPKKKCRVHKNGYPVFAAMVRRLDRCRE